MYYIYKFTYIFLTYMYEAFRPYPVVLEYGFSTTVHVDILIFSYMCLVPIIHPTVQSVPR